MQRSSQRLCEKLKTPYLAALASVVVTVVVGGCATPAGGSYSYSKQQRDEDIRKLAETTKEFVSKTQSEAVALRADFEKCKAENVALQKKQSDLVGTQADFKKAVELLKLNDRLIENKSDLVDGLQKEWEPNKYKFFKAMVGKGELKEFKVEDTCLYHGYVAVAVLFLWSGDEGWGGLGRGFVMMDPDKEFSITDATMAGTIAIPAEEYASLLQSSSPQLEERVAKIEPYRIAAEGSAISEQTKQKLIDAGIAVGTAVGTHFLLNWVDSLSK
jgi:hypothetical protein